jgi:hypothetical protein
MFQLHDSTRRRVCIAGFLTLGLLPALVIAGWCIERRLPGSVEAEAQQLSRQLGLDVKLGGLQYPQPGRKLYERLELNDPETGQTLFRCRLLELARQQQSNARGQSRPALTLAVAQPELEAAALNRVWRCLERIIEGACGPLETDVQLSAAELTLWAAGNSQTLTEVRGTLENLSGGMHARLDFRLAGVTAPEPAHIRVVRNRQVSPPASGFELDSGGGELPCNVLAMGLKELAPLGPRCRFRGCLWANETPSGWQGEITGQLVELDLGALVTDHFPHRLNGIGEVTIQSARFRGGRLEEGAATLVAGPGTIDRSLLVAAVERLGLAKPTEKLPAGETVPYKQLAFLATLDAQGLRLSGRCDPSGTILCGDDQKRLLGEPQEQPAPAVALVRTLVPQSAVQVPASRQTDWLLRHLPVPEVMPPAGAESVLPHARLRLPDTHER